MELLKKVTLEINKEFNRKIKAKQNDTARYLLFTIVDNGVPFSLQGKEVKIFAVKPDGKLVYNACQITNPTNGEGKLNLTSQMLAVPGILNAELVINEGNEILSTIPFEIEVIKSLRDDSAIESTNEFTILFSKIEEGKSLEVSLSELIEEGLPLYNKLNPVVEVGKELNTSLPPKTSEADRILKQLLQAIQNGNLDNFMNKAPIRLDKKDLNTITDPGRYVCANCTNAPTTYGRMDILVWNEYKSARWLTQIFYSDVNNKVYTRCSTNAEGTEYTQWAMMYSTTNKPTPADIGAQPKEATTFTQQTDYIAVRTPARKNGQYYEFWDPNNSWADIHCGEIYARGYYKVYHTNNKPTPADIGAAANDHNHDTRYLKTEDIQFTNGELKAGDKILATTDPDLLWDGGEGGWVFDSGKKIKLPKKISDMPNGLLTLWSTRNSSGTVHNWHWVYGWIPKQHLKVGGAVVLPLAGGMGNPLTKMVYITEDTISGHDSNMDSGPNLLVLRKIYEW